MEISSLYEQVDVKNDALRFIRSYSKVTKKKDLSIKLDALKKVVVNCPLSDREVIILLTVFTKNMSDFTDSEFEKFLLCCLPDSELDSNLSEKLGEWLLRNYPLAESTNRCIVLIKWMNSMLNNNLINKDHLDMYYPLFFDLLNFDEYHCAVCPFLFAVSDYGNTLPWMISYVEKILKKDTTCKVLKFLLKKIKLNGIKSNISGNLIIWPYASGLPAMSKMLNEKRGISKSKYALALNDVIQTDNDVTSSRPTSQESDIIPLAQVTSPETFVGMFQFISLPKNIQMLLTSNLGTLKSVLDTELEDDVRLRLKSKLCDMFIGSNRAKYKDSERRCFLQSIYSFQNLIQQEVDCVSNFLSFYIQTWNGLDFKEEILNLCEWVVFASWEEMLEKLLKPLHDIFISEEVQNKDLYLKTYSQLYKNLIIQSSKMLHKNTTAEKEFLFCGAERKYCWMSNEEESNLVLTNVSRFVLMECTTAVLFNSENRIELIANTLNFILTAIVTEDYYNRSLLTIIPRAIVSLAIFSTDLKNISRVCHILNKYKEFQAKERLYGLFMEEMSLVDRYIEDYINFLWRKTGWRDSYKGEIFRSMNNQTNELQTRYSKHHLNGNLHVRKHIAFALLANQLMKMLKFRDKLSTDEEYLDIIVMSLSPTIVSFIKTYRY